MPNAGEIQQDMSDLEVRLAESLERLLAHGRVMSETADPQDRARIFAAMVADAHTAHLG